VLIVAPSPSLPYKAPECLSRNREAFCAMSRTDFNHQRAEAWAAIEHAAKGRRNVRVFDPASFLCDEQLCPAKRSGVATYMDSGHMTTAASRNLATSVGADLCWLGGRVD
jgi:hypothetical protein